MGRYVAGIDVGGTDVKLGLFSTEGKLIKKWSIHTGKYDDDTGLFRDIADSLKAELEKEKLTVDDIEAVGMGVPGPVIGGHTINRCLNLGMGVVDVRRMVEPIFWNKKVAVLNDANAATLGEMWQGSGKDYSNLVLATLGTGIGGGIIVDKKIVTGHFGAGGEIGHIKVVADETERCSCGGYGCFEQYCSATGLVRLYKRAGGQEEVDAKRIFELAKDKDPIAMETLDKFSEIFGRAIAAVCVITDPEAVIIGGGVSNAGDVLIDMLKKKYQKYAFHTSLETKFVKAKLLNDAGIYGSAYYVLNS